MSQTRSRRRSRARFAPLLALAFAACGDSPTSTPTDPGEEALDALFTDSGAHGTDADRGRPLFLRRLARLALEHVEDARGTDAVHPLRMRLAELEAAVHEAREAGDEEALHAATVALESGAARIVIHVFGPRVAPRVVHHGWDRYGQLRERVAAAHEDGHDVGRARRILHAAASLLEEARGAAAAHDAHAALRLGARALDLMSFMD